MQPSIFTRIINGEIPCYKVYEDESTMAFLDIHPIQPGQVLVVTKAQIADFYNLPQAQYAAFFDTVKKIAKQLKRTFPEAKRIGVMLEGLDVDHVHAKIFPISTGEQYRNVPDMSTEPNQNELEYMAKRIIANE